MKKNTLKVAFLTVLICGLVGCSPGNKEYLKERAVATWNQQGFEVVAYEGYQWGFWGFTKYGGASVWHRLRKIPDNGLTYSGHLVRWGDEIHVYGPKAVEGAMIQQIVKHDTTKAAY